MTDYIKLQCPCCELTFVTEYYEFGAITHNNTLTNMGNFVRLWDKGEDKKKLFLRSIHLDGNLCNIKDNSIKVGREIFTCVLMYLHDNGREDIVEGLISSENSIVDEYNNVRLRVIEGLKNQIKKEESYLI